MAHTVYPWNQYSIFEWSYIERFQLDIIIFPPLIQNFSFADFAWISDLFLPWGYFMCYIDIYGVSTSSLCRELIGWQNEVKVTGWRLYNRHLDNRRIKLLVTSVHFQEPNRWRNLQMKKGFWGVKLSHFC